MDKIKNGVTSAYFQFVNFVQTMNPILYFTIWAVLFAVGILSLVAFFKKHDGTKTSFVGKSKLFISILFFILLVVFTILRK